MSEAPYVHINWTRYSDVRLSRSHCPVCERKTFFVSCFQDWYGWDQTCLKCGDRWQDGEMCDRPFMPKWRKKSIESAKKTYRKFMGGVAVNLQKLQIADCATTHPLNHGTNAEGV